MVAKSSKSAAHAVCAAWAVAAAILLGPAAVQAEVIVPTPAAQAILLGQTPEAGQAQVLDFEGLPFATALTGQFLGQGVEFTSPFSLVTLPLAFGSQALPPGSAAAFVGFVPEAFSEVTLLFPEPQLTLAARFIDVGDPLQVEASLDGVPVETFFMEAQGENVDGGIFRGIWFVDFVDEVRFLSADAEDGFGLDDLQVALPGSVDNDLDGFSDLEGDCLDTNPSVNPDAFDDCDGFDTDCDGLIDEDDDQDGDGVLACQGDCDDDDPTIFPPVGGSLGAVELCDGIDQDCNGTLDDPVDFDGDGFNVCEGDCDDSTALVAPSPVGAEVCDGLDNDCDGLIDESPDADGDDFTICEGDCDDTDPLVFPGQGCDPPVGDDDDTAPGDDDDTSSGDDDDTSPGDDDDTSPGDDDDTSPGDDDTSPGDDDDTSSGDDDDTSPGDDDASGDDDDTTAGDDDTSVGDDDTSAGDDDTAVGDDDASGDDDSSGGGDSVETWAPPGPVLGIAGGGCFCAVEPSAMPASALALLPVIFVRRRRRRAARRDR